VAASGVDASGLDAGESARRSNETGSRADGSTARSLARVPRLLGAGRAAGPFTIGAGGATSPTSGVAAPDVRAPSTVSAAFARAAQQPATRAAATIARPSLPEVGRIPRRLAAR